MWRSAAGIVVFFGGFAIMVLEVIGARYLARDFGGSFYVWISQIGVVMVAMALGYVGGGALADRRPRASVLGGLLLLAGAITWLIPDFTPGMLEAIVTRHAENREIPRLWQKLDPMLGSTAVFFLPCAILAMIPPFMIRLLARRLATVGLVSGLVYAGGTLGSIAGVFISGYVLIDHLTIPRIFRVTGVLTLALGGVAYYLDRVEGLHASSKPFPSEEDRP